MPARRGPADDFDMDAAAIALRPAGPTARGSDRLLADCARLSRLTSCGEATARLRLERELGCDLAQLLMGALVAHPARVA
jgi:hypothetical protein